MLKRLLLGLVIGLVVGALVAAGAIAGLGMLTFSAVGAFAAYALAASTGVLTGLVAGKPIWAKGGQIEAGLKAFFGALLAAGGMYAIRMWLHQDVDLAMLHAGQGAVGDLPGASLPIIGAVLGGLYELDNTPGSDEKRSEDKNDKKVRVATGTRVAQDEGAEQEDAAPPAAKKRTR